MFSHLFLVGYFSYLQVTMAYVRAWMSLKFGQIRPQTTVRITEMKHFFSVSIAKIHFKFVGN